MISSHLIQAIAPAYAMPGENGRGAVFPDRSYKTGREIGVVPIVGILDKGDLVDARIKVNELAADDRVGEILMIVDSPGGTVAGTDDLSRAVARAAASKRVTAYIEDLGASAAYYAICGASEIVCNPTGHVGSIGVYVVVADASRMFEKAGIDILVIRSGPHKGRALYGAKITSEQVDEIQSMVDELARHFVSAVSRGRKMTVERVRDLADGRVFIGNQAKAAGLVDRIATLEDVFDEIRQRTQPMRYAELVGFDADQKFTELVGEFPGEYAEVSAKVRYPKLWANVEKHREEERKRKEEAYRYRRVHG
jgi:protease-4